MEIRKRHLQNIIVCEKYSLPGSHLPPYASLRDTSARRGSHSRANTKRANSLTSSLTDEPSGYTSRLKNELQSCMRGGRDLIFVTSKRYPVIYLSFSLSFLHARACMFDETTSYFSLIFMLIGEFPYLPVIT